MITSFHKYLINFNIIDTYLLILVFTTAFLLLFSVVFALYTIFLRIRNNRTQKKRLFLEKMWEPLILDILSGRPLAQQLMDTVRKKEEYYFVEYIMRYAQVLSGDDRRTVTELAYPFLGRLVKMAKKAEPETRAYAVKTLSTIRFDEYVDEIIAALDDPSPIVCMVAAQALCQKEHPQYVCEVLKSLHWFESWSLYYIAAMLASAGQEAAPALREAYGDPRMSFRVRSIAAEALHMINDFSSADIAAQVLESDKDRDLFATSLRLLKAFGQTKHIDQVRALCSADDEVIRAQALSALGSLGDLHETEYLYSALSDTSTWVVLHAARGLVSAGATNLLKEVAATDYPQAEIAREVLREIEQ